MKNNLAVHGVPKPRRTNDSPIARIRMERGLTQVQLAALVGTQPNNISRWELGTSIPNSDNLMRVAAALECSMDELIQK